MDGVKHIICPVCGFNFFKNRNLSKEIFKLLSKRSKKTRKTIEKISECIRNNVPSDSTKTPFYYFLLSIKDSKDEEIIWGMEIFYKNRYYYSGKGYKYLSKIITNRTKNLIKVAKNERKRIGSPPPTIKTKESK